MGGLGHYLEAEGIATTGISLIRLHSEKIRPPRALWVPFELGRPMGAPGDRAGQEKVLRHALSLLGRAGPGPILDDYPEEQAPGSSGWTPPELPWRGSPPSGAAGWQRALEADIAALYDRWERRRAAFGRSTVGVAGLSVESLPAFMARFAEGEPQGAVSDLKQAAQTLRYAADDLKAFVMEAADDGPDAPPSTVLANWFWDETAAGAFLWHLRGALAGAEHPRLKAVGAGMLVPGTQVARRTA